MYAFVSKSPSSSEILGPSNYTAVFNKCFSFSYYKGICVHHRELENTDKGAEENIKSLLISPPSANSYYHSLIHLTNVFVECLPCTEQFEIDLFLAIYFYILMKSSCFATFH